MKHIEDALRELGKVEDESDGFTDDGKASLKMVRDLLERAKELIGAETYLDEMSKSESWRSVLLEKLESMKEMQIKEVPVDSLIRVLKTKDWEGRITAALRAHRMNLLGKPIFGKVSEVHDEVMFEHDPHNGMPHEIHTAREEWKLAHDEANHEGAADGHDRRAMNGLLNAVDYILAFMEKTHSVPLHAMQWDYSALEQRVAALTKMSQQEGVPFPLTMQVPKSWDEMRADTVSKMVQERAIEKTKEADRVVCIRGCGDWEDDRVQFPRLLAELYAAGELSMDTETSWDGKGPEPVGYWSVNLKHLQESMDLSWDRIQELFKRADRAFSRDKAKTLSLAPTERERELIATLENELHNRGLNDWTFGGDGIDTWETGTNWIKLFLDRAVHLTITVEEVVESDDECTCPE